MLRNYLLILISYIFPFALSAMSAEEAMSKTAQKIADAPGITAMFTAVGQTSAPISGKLTISKEKFSMLGDDFGVWYNGNCLWNYAKQTGETTLSIPTSEELMEINPLDVISNYSTHYKATKISDKNNKIIIKLTAKSKGASVQTALLTVNTSTWLPEEISATFSNSTTLQISIASAKVSAAVPAQSTFQYPASKYPGIDVIDLR